MIDQIFDALSATLSRSLDVRMQRHNMLTSNLANADTPNFVPVDLDFRDTLQSVSEGVSGENVPKPQSYYDVTVTPGPDGNAVDFDHEMSRLASNQINYQASVRVLNQRMALMRYAITEGRG